MKNRTPVVLMALFLCLSLLAACTPDIEPEQQPPQSESTQHSELLEQNQTEPTQSPQPAEPESTEPQIFYTGEANVKPIYRGTHHTLDHTMEGRTYDLSFPYIVLPGEDVAKLNAKFLEQYMQRINEDGEFETVYAYSYDWYVNGDILSLVVTNQTWLNVWNYEIYNIKISTCKLMETEEVLAAAGVTEEDFYERVKDMLGNAYFTRDYVRICAPVDQDPIEYFYWGMSNGDPWMLSETVSEENVTRCVPYLNENGKLCFTGLLSTGAGYGWGSELFVWNEDYERSPYYGEYLEMFET